MGKKGAGGALADLQGPELVSTPTSGSQSSVTVVLSGLLEHHIHVLPRHTCKQKTHTHKNKISKQIKKKLEKKKGIYKQRRH